MQLTHVFLNRPLPPIAQGGQMPVKMFAVGMRCNDAYGGGSIASIQERNGTIVIRKDKTFVMKSHGKDEPFDFVAVFPGGEYAYGVDPKPVETESAQAPDVQPGQCQLCGGKDKHDDKCPTQKEAGSNGQAPSPPPSKPAQSQGLGNTPNLDPPPAKPIPQQGRGK